MNFKPGDFFIGLFEFFTVLLPGAALASILLIIQASYRDTSFLGINFHEALYKYMFQSETISVFWVVFFFTSFILGYVLFSIGSALDNYLYDPIRKRIYPYVYEYRMVFSNNSNKNDYDQHKAKIVSSYEEDWGKKKEKNDPCKCQNGNREVITSTDICYCNIKQDNRLKFENYLNQILHFLVDTSFDIKYDDSVEKARALVPKLSGNLFETSKVILNQWYPVIAAEEVNRPLIVSKFFRSIIIVNFITLVLPLLNYIKYSCRDSIFCLTFILVLICLLIILKIVLKIVYNQFFSFCCAIGSVLLIGLTTALIFKNLYYSFVAAILFFSFREYIRQRYKSTQAAYRAFVNLYNWQNDTKPKEPQNQLLSILLPKANKAKKM